MPGPLAAIQPNEYGSSPLRGVLLANVPKHEQNPDGYLNIITGQSTGSGRWISNLLSPPTMTESDTRVNPFENLYGKTAPVVGEDQIQSVQHEVTASLTALTLPNMKLMRPDLSFTVKMAGDVAASTTRGTGNAGLTVTADEAGTAGNSIRFAIVVSGNSTPLSVAVAGNDITVNAATDGAGAATSTANQVIAAINAHVGASALVTASLPGSSDGTGVVAASAMAALTGGAAGSTPVGVRMKRTLQAGPSYHLKNLVIAYSTSTHTIGRDVILGNPMAISEEREYSLSEDLEVFGVEVTWRAYSTTADLDLETGVLLPSFEENDYTVTSIPAGL